MSTPTISPDTELELPSLDEDPRCEVVLSHDEEGHEDHECGERARWVGKAPCECCGDITTLLACDQCHDLLEAREDIQFTWVAL